MYLLVVSEEADKSFKKFFKKDKKQKEVVKKKIKQILVNPFHFKPLKYSLKGERRVHVGSFVLTFEIKGNKIIILDYDHHDMIYRSSS